MLHKHGHPAVAGNYWLGATLGASVSATALLIASGLVSPVPASARATLFILILVMLGLHVARVLCLPLPERRHQIPRETFDGSPRGAALRFAFELGLGFRTYVPAASPYALVAGLVLINGPDLTMAVLSTAAAAVGFGLGRARVVAGHALRRTAAVEHPAGWLRAADAVSLMAMAALGVRALA